MRIDAERGHAERGHAERGHAERPCGEAKPMAHIRPVAYVIAAPGSKLAAGGQQAGSKRTAA